MILIIKFSEFCEILSRGISIGIGFLTIANALSTNALQVSRVTKNFAIFPELLDQRDLLTIVPAILVANLSNPQIL